MGIYVRDINGETYVYILSGKKQFFIGRKDDMKNINIENLLKAIDEFDKTYDKQTKLAKMLTNEHVKRWHDNLARGSPLTAEVRVRRLGAFCSQYKMRPGQIIDKAGKDIRAVSDMLEDHVTYMESKNYSPTYILDYVKAIKSWLRHFDIEIKRKIKVSNSHKTTLEP